MPNLRGSELLILVLVVVILFGAKRLPDAARGIGRSLRIFKAESKGLVEGSTELDEPAADTDGSRAPAAIEPPTAKPQASGLPDADGQAVPRAEPPHQA